MCVCVCVPQVSRAGTGDDPSLVGPTEADIEAEGEGAIGEGDKEVKVSQYPAAVRSHEEVCSSREVFSEELEKLQSALGTGPK